MHNRFTRLALAGSLVASVSSPAVAMAQGHDYLFSGGNHYVRLESGRVVIRAGTGERAVIARTGTLAIGGRPVAVPARDQARLSDYYRTVTDLRQQAKSVANKAVGDAFRTVGDVLAAVFSGAGNGKAVAADQKKLRLSVRADIAPLCQKVGRLEALQDKIAVDVPAFRPYAVVKRSDITSCRH